MPLVTSRHRQRNRNKSVNCNNYDKPSLFVDVSSRLHSTLRPTTCIYASRKTANNNKSAGRGACGSCHFCRIVNLALVLPLPIPSDEMTRRSLTEVEEAESLGRDGDKEMRRERQVLGVSGEPDEEL